ncbi:MAG: MFS transporter [SAR202 cluster bacterium Io17-Chloro-G9]|nr:MAG: MFS transporter [SAR202 cluster bacterium Io17-Chloro-G9]
MAVATLSVFVVPMTDQLGWSRGLFSGAVSVGGLCAVVVTPFVGRWIDRYGSGTLIAVSSLLTGACAIGISLVSLPWAFYSLYVPGRMVFAGPLELSIPTAISNWFVRRRPLGLAIDSVFKGLGLACMPLAAQVIIGEWGWRTAWVSMGIFALAVGVLPPLLLMARRPEDMGLEPDPAPAGPGDSEKSAETGFASVQDGQSRMDTVEPGFSLSQAVKARAFWLIAVFSAATYMVQAGVSLHQVPHYIDQGLPGGLAAITAGVYALSQIAGGVIWAWSSRRFPIRVLLAGAAFVVGAGAIATAASSTMDRAVAASITLGLGVGGLHLLLRLVYAEYYGRQNLGSIRGLGLSFQVAGQGLGPVVAGFMFDSTRSYQLPLMVFTVAAFSAGVMVLAATPPRRPLPVPG